MSVIRLVNDKVKLRKKLLKRFAVVATVSILLTAVFMTAAFWLLFSKQESSELKTLAYTISNIYNSDNINSVDGVIFDGDARITLIASDGRVLYDSEGDTENMPNHADRPEFAEALEKGSGSSSRMSATLNTNTCYYAVKTQDGNVLRVSKTYDSIVYVFIRTIPMIVLIVIVVFAICIILSRFATRKIIEPIENMSQNLENTPYEELEPIVKTINSQQKEIKKQVRKLQLERDKINTLIQNMSEGFILIDMDKNVLMSNNSANKLVGADVSKMEGKRLLEYSRNETVNECVDSAIKGTGLSGDITINGRVLQIITNPVYSNNKQNGVICIIIDVSEKKKAEKMRREFTANVTHELKTPLTSISGYAEIIASGLARPDDVQGFARRIHKESGRLLTLIGDIIKLSQLDETLSEEEYVSFDIAGVANEVAEDLRTNAEKHDVTISTETEKAVIKGNRNQFYELIYNLCDNAIRYNRPRGSVKITVQKTDKNCIIKVSDTGIGIPEKHHQRIFERFYRVDKSRSKETGGTGLGLAIVKHITERHGGSISVESGQEGTTFTVVF